MFRAAQLWKVCYRQTIVTSVGESKFSFAISKTHGGEMKSPRTEKKINRGKKKGREGKREKKRKGARESMGDGFIILPNVNSPTSFPVPMGTKQEKFER